MKESTSAHARKKIENPMDIQETKMQTEFEQLTAPSISVSKHSRSFSSFGDPQLYSFAIECFFDLGKHYIVGFGIKNI